MQKQQARKKLPQGVVDQRNPNAQRPTGLSEKPKRPLPQNVVDQRNPNKPKPGVTNYKPGQPRPPAGMGTPVPGGGAPTSGASSVWKPGDVMKDGRVFAGWVRDPNNPGKYRGTVRDAQGRVVPLGGAGAGQVSGGAQGASGGGQGGQAQQGGAQGQGQGFFAGAWSAPSAAYDLSKGTLRGLVRDFNSPSGWSALDEYGRRVGVTDVAAAMRAGWQKLTKDQVLAVNPNFYGGGATPTTDQSQQQQAVPSWMQMFAGMFPQVGGGGVPLPGTQGGLTTNPGGLTWQQLMLGQTTGGSTPPVVGG